MIPAERLVRLLKNLTDISGYPPRWAQERLGEMHVQIRDCGAELDLEDRATLARLWSGEIDEVTAGERPHLPGAVSRYVLDLLRDLLVDGAHQCASPLICMCSTGRARRFLLDHGIEVPE